MKEEALKLAKYLYRLNGYMDMPRFVLDITHPAAEIIEKLVAELDKQGEPVAWMYKMEDGSAIVSVRMMFNKDAVSEIPLYTAPQTKPLSDEEINQIYKAIPNKSFGEIYKLARAIEEHHGIK